MNKTEISALFLLITSVSRGSQTLGSHSQVGHEQPGGKYSVKKKNTIVLLEPVFADLCFSQPLYC